MFAFALFTYLASCSSISFYFHAMVYSSSSSYSSSSCSSSCSSSISSPSSSTFHSLCCAWHELISFRYRTFHKGPDGTYVKGGLGAIDAPAQKGAPTTVSTGLGSFAWGKKIVDEE